MSKVHDPAPDEVRDRVRSLLHRYYQDLQAVGIRIDLVFAANDSEDSPAVSLGGYPAYAVVRVLGEKDRAMGRGDAEIVIDRDKYEAMTDERRDALLDHEIYHLELKRGKTGRVLYDAHARPKLTIRKHDRQFGWFDAIAARHGEHAIEVQQAREMKREVGQVYFDFEETGFAGLRELVNKGDATSVTMRVGNSDTQTVIDKSGIRNEPVTKPAPTTEADREDLLQQVTDLVRETGKATVSMLQRRLRITFNDGSAIMDELEKRGVVSAPDEAGKRTVLPVALAMTDPEGEGDSAGKEAA